MSVGRNQPCPCGSGRKYKRCCGKGAAPKTTRYDQQARTRALIRMAEYAEEMEWFADEMKAAFFGDLPQPEDELERMIGDQVFEWWLYFDAKLDLDERLVDAFLFEHGEQLPRAERAYLEAMRDTEMRLWEVTEVRVGSSLTLRDLLDGSRVVKVRERSGSRSLHRWDIVACRVVSVGASGRPEIDGGVLPFTRTMRERLVDWLHRIRAQFEQDEPDASSQTFFEVLPPLLHRSWADPAPPTIVNYDGDQLLLTKAHFDVVDRARLESALDDTEGLERDQSEARWIWAGTATQRAEVVTFGWFDLASDQLVLETNSKQRADRGIALVETIAPGAARHRVTETQDPLLQALAEHGDAPRPALESHPEEIQRQLVALAERQLQEHYERWIDEPVPMFDDETPRKAAASNELRSRVVEALKDLERAYEEQLLAGDATFDPFWLWDELGLRELRDGDRRSPPLLGHETMARQVEGLGALAGQIANRARAESSDDLERVVSRSDLVLDLGVQRLVRAHASKLAAENFDLEAASEETDLLASHIELAANFELHRRKVFWVADELSWMLGATRLDVTGAMLRPPFASFALVFTDRHALGLAERALVRDPSCRLRGRMLRVLTAYVTTIHGGLRIAFTCDALDDDWPYLLVRDLPIDEEVRLDELLMRRIGGASTDELAPIFRCAPLEELLRLVLNAILYATSADAKTEERPPPAPRKRAGRRQRGLVSSEHVYYLPGTIDITALRAVQRVRRGAVDAEQTHRCMVRGHWRRAPRGWKDRRARWIRPYWRGPSAAAIIERQYRLEP